MTCVIFAAGKGTRLQPLTDTIPKSMVDVGSRPLLAHIIDALPPRIDRLVIVTGYRGETIQAHFGSSYRDRSVQYVDQGPLNGSAGALIATRSILADRESFLVLHGDNLYAAEDLERLANGPLALGIYRYIRPTVKLVFDADKAGRLTGAHQPIGDELTRPVAVCTGSYLLDSRIFNVPPVVLPDGELGLPHTVVKLAKTVSISLFEHTSWQEVNTHADLARVRSFGKLRE